MNAVAKHSGALTTPAAANQTEAQRKAHQISEIDRICVAPVRRARATWSGAGSDSFRTALGARENRSFDAARFVSDNDAQRRLRQRQSWEGGLERIMPRAEVEGVIRAVQTAWSAKPDRNRSGVIIGRMIDSFPNARPHNPATYRENLVHLCEVDGYSPAVVALACDRIMRDEKHEFLPAPAVFLAACKQEFDELRNMHRHAHITLEGRNHLETALAKLNAAEEGTEPALPVPIDNDLQPPAETIRSAIA